MGLKTTSVGYFTIPTAPAAGTSCTSGAANVFATTYVQLIASTAAALFITGVHLNFQTTSKPTYVCVQLATGGAGSETIISQVLVPFGVTSGATGTFSNCFALLPIPVPVATSTRIAVKTADSVGALAALVSLQCIAQANVIDMGVNESCNVIQWNSTNVASPATAGIPEVNVKNINNVSTSSVTTVNANQGTTQPINFTSTGVNALVKVDAIDWASGAIPAPNVTGVPLVDDKYLLGTIYSTPATAGLMDINVKNWSGTIVASTNLAGVPVVDDRGGYVRVNTAQSGTNSTIQLDASAPTGTDDYKGAMVCILTSTANDMLGQSRIITAYDGSTKTATVTPNWPEAPSGGEKFAIRFASANLQTILQAASVGSAGYIGIDWAQIANPTTTQNLSATDIHGVAATINANVTQFNGVNATSSAGRPEVNTTHIAGAIVNTSSAQIGVNVVNWRGTAVPAPATAGIPDVNAKNINNVATTSVTTINANQGTTQPINFTGTAGSALVKADVIDVAGTVQTARDLGAQLDAAVSTRATPAQVKTQMTDALNVDTYAEPGQGAPAATNTLVAKLGYLFKAWRNKSDQTSALYQLYADDTTTVDQKATVSDDTVTFARQEVASGP